MGGNLRLLNLSNEIVSSQPLKVTNDLLFRLDEDLFQFTEALNSRFFASYGKKIWKNSLLDNFSGSTKVLLQEKNALLKSEISDIDMLIPNGLGADLISFLKCNRNHTFGNFLLLAVKEQPNDEIANSRGTNIIVRWESQNIQIDFAPTDMTNLQWANFCHSSHVDDLTLGIKGVFHKYLVQALVESESTLFEDENVILTPKSKLPSLGFAPTIMKDYAAELHMNSFSVEKGLCLNRLTKVDKAYDWDTRRRINYFKLTEPANKNYNKSVSQIFDFIFKDSKYDERFESFVGILALLTERHRQFSIANIYEIFINKLFSDE